MAVTTSAAAKASSREQPGAAQQWVYLAEDAPADNKDLLGGKGAGLAAMTQAGLPVPAAFTITTAACNAYQQAGGTFPEGLWDQTIAALRTIEQKSGRTLGDASNPLLVSVRSGAKFSMPGMMDTVLNLGLNDETVQGLARLTSNERFAWDAYRRFVQMFGRIVLGVSGEKLDHAFEEAKRAAGVKQDTELGAEQLREVTQQLKELVQKDTGQPFPTDVLKQLE